MSARIFPPPGASCSLDCAVYIVIQNLGLPYVITPNVDLQPYLPLGSFDGGLFLALTREVLSTSQTSPVYFNSRIRKASLAFAFILCLPAEARRILLLCTLSSVSCVLIIVPGS